MCYNKLKVGKFSKTHMSKKLILGSATLGAVAGFFVNLVAHAQIVVPTSTVASLQTVAGGQISDAGTLLVVVLAAGVPLAFYIIHKLIGLIPKGRGGRRE